MAFAERLEIHHTPKHGSWLDMAEIEMNALARDLPERVGERANLVRHIAAWTQRRNQAQVKANCCSSPRMLGLNSASFTLLSMGDRVLEHFQIVSTETSSD